MFFGNDGVRPDGGGHLFLAKAVSPPLVIADAHPLFRGALRQAVATACRSAPRNSGWSSAMTRCVLTAAVIYFLFLRKLFLARALRQKGRIMQAAIVPPRGVAFKRPNFPYGQEAKRAPFAAPKGP